MLWVLSWVLLLLWVLSLAEEEAVRGPEVRLVEVRVPSLEVRLVEVWVPSLGMELLCLPSHSL